MMSKDEHDHTSAEERKIREAALLRSYDREELGWDPQSMYDGITSNINGNFRKGTPVHLAWKLHYTGC